MINKIKNYLKKFYRIIIYNIFFYKYGEIKGVIYSDQDNRVKVQSLELGNKHNYKIYKITNGRLYTDRVHDTAIILDNSIVSGPSFQLRDNKNESAERNMIFEKGTTRIIKKKKGKILSLLTGGGGNANYWHWLYDVLPRLKIVKKIIDIEKIDYFLLPSLDEKFQNETLDELKIPKSKRLSSKHYRHVTSDEIIVTDHPYNLLNDPNQDANNIPIWISDWLKKSFINQNDTNSKRFPKKIYIDRKDAKSNHSRLRNIVNEDEVKNLLKANDFEILVMSNFSFADQVKLFNNANFVIGLHGGGFANLVFCEQKTRVLELKAFGTGKQIENFAESNNLNYDLLVSESSSAYSRNQLGDITVDMESLDKKIQD